MPKPRKCLLLLANACFWYCEKCSERNFLKRMECYKCRAPRPKDGGGEPPKVPATGTTLNGMVKSYNRIMLCIHTEMLTYELLGYTYRER